MLKNQKNEFDTKYSEIFFDEKKNLFLTTKFFINKKNRVVEKVEEKKILEEFENFDKKKNKELFELCVEFYKKKFFRYQKLLEEKENLKNFK